LYRGIGYDGRVSRSPLVAVVLLLVCGSAAQAQKDSVVAVGGTYTFLIPASDDADLHAGAGVTARLRRGTGVGFVLGFQWFSADVRTDVDGLQVPLGAMTIRPLMLGVSVGRQFAKFAVGAGLVGGWSFNSISQTPAQQQAYRDAVGMPDAEVRVTTGWAVRPSVTLWRELGNHFGAFVSAGYIFNRPTVTTRGAGGQWKNTVNLDASIVSFGVAYGVF
jgi:hypothetical protein